jgi:hypothetical protein
MTAMTSMQPPVEAKQAVVDACERGAQWAGGDKRYLSLAHSALKMVGLELARYLRPGEIASLCVPAEVAHDGRHDPGMVLLLDDRAVVAWFEGTVRVTRRSLYFAYGDISEVTTVARDRGRLAVYRDAISFTAGGARHEFVLPSKVAKAALAGMVSGVMSGAVTFNRDSAAG